MKKVAYITDPIFLRHDTGPDHPESAERLIAIDRAVTTIKSDCITLCSFRVSEKILELIHTPAQIEEVREASFYQKAIDSDTICSVDSYDAALAAVGTGIIAVDGIAEGRFERAFCAVRPPGHHATTAQSMGFCLFNNIAVCARYAQEKGYRKVMIVDFDVHHGNGTQDAFWEDSSVFYFGTHQAFAYPGTGDPGHIGSSEGKGYTSNHPLMPGSGDEEILDIYRNEYREAVDFFVPDILLVSAGYDLHESDPLASLNVTTEGIRMIVRELFDSTDVPVIFFLEGGYDTEALGQNVLVTLEEMLR